MGDVIETTEKGTKARVAVALIGMGLMAAAGGCSSSGTGPVAWKTDTVSLTASEFWIVADGQTYAGSGSAVDVHSDPGDPTYTTLELIWTEHGREMRYFTYFHADGRQWWSDEMRTFDAQPSSDWLFYHGTYFSSPVGAAFHGDVDLTNDATDSIRGELHLHGLALSTTLGSSPGP